MGHTGLAVSNLNTGYKLQWFWLGISFYNICQIQVTVICLLGIFFYRVQVATVWLGSTFYNRCNVQVNEVWL